MHSSRTRVGRRQHDCRHRSGATTVEFAVVLPIAVLIFLMTIDLARANSLRNSLKTAAYAGCRAAIIPGGTAADAQAAAQRELNIVGESGATITTIPATITTTDTQITVQITCPLNSPTLAIFGMTLQQSCTLTREPAQSGY